MFITDANEPPTKPSRVPCNEQPTQPKVSPSSLSHSSGSLSHSASSTMKKSLSSSKSPDGTKSPSKSLKLDKFGIKNRFRIPLDLYGSLPKSSKYMPTSTRSDSPNGSLPRKPLSRLPSSEEQGLSRNLGSCSAIFQSNCCKGPRDKQSKKV